MANCTTKSTEIETLVSAKGRLLESAVSEGISIRDRFFVSTSTR